MQWHAKKNAVLIREEQQEQDSLETFKLDGQSLQIVNEIEYLGLRIDKNGFKLAREKSKTKKASQSLLGFIDGEKK